MRKALAGGSCIRLRLEHRNHVWSHDFVEDRTHDGGIACSISWTVSPVNTSATAVSKIKYGDPLS